jgi:hypothetical protein
MFRPTAGAVVAAALAACLAGASAQEKEKPAEAPAAPELRFADGSAVRMALLQDQIEVQTRYGKLLVPLAEVRSIEFGLRISPEAARRLEAAAAGLASEDFQSREKAAADLIALRELAWPTVRGLSKSPDKEVARRAAELQEKMAGMLTEEQRGMRAFDVVRTDAFEVRGTIVGNGLKVRSPYFGDVQADFATLRGYRRMTLSDLEREVTVDAAKYGGPNVAWLDTGIEVDGDTSVLIQAGGEVDLNPQAGGQFKTGPGGGGPQMVRRFGPVGDQMPGALMGRFGERGREFLVGERFEGKPTERGKLYLRINASPFGGQSSGEYKVKVALR